MLLKPHVVNIEGRISATVRDEVGPVVPLHLSRADPQVFGRDGVVAAIIIGGDRRAAVVVDALAGLSDVTVGPPRAARTRPRHRRLRDLDVGIAAVRARRRAFRAGRASARPRVVVRSRS